MKTPNNWTMSIESLLQYDGIVGFNVKPCVMDLDQVRRPDKDEKIDFYGVYMRLDDGREICVADREVEFQAIALSELLFPRLYVPGNEQVVKIARERQRQIEMGHTPGNDGRAYLNEELAAAAACYAMPSHFRMLGFIWRTIGMGKLLQKVPKSFPWDAKWWKPKNDLRGRKHDLVKAGALIVAQLEVLEKISEK